MATVKVSVGAEDPVKCRDLFQTYVVAGRIHFPEAVEVWWLTPSRPAREGL